LIKIVEQESKEKAKLEALENRKVTLQKELEELQIVYKKSVKSLKANKLEIKNHEEKIQNFIHEKEEKSKNLEKRKKIMELMPSGEENLQKLREIIAKKKTKILGIQDQFELHKQSLLDDREKMKKEIETLKQQNQYEVKPNDISTRDQITITQTQLEEQKKLGLKYSKQMEKIPGEFTPRSAYTDQIMEILNKVAKQKSETKKVIEDIHGIQKDINMLEGKLSRTYADVDHRLFEQAKRDKSIIPTYRLLVEIHKASDEMIETIRKTGQIRRSTKTIQESISVEKDKKVEVKLAKLKSDLDHIKMENARLRKGAKN